MSHSRESATDEQVQYVYDWLQEANRQLTHREIANLLGFSESHIGAISRGRKSAGVTLFQTVKEFAESTPDTFEQDELKQESPQEAQESPSNASEAPTPTQATVETLTRTHELICEARTLLHRGLRTNTFRPLLRPGVEELLDLLDSAHALLEYEA